MEIKKCPFCGDPLEFTKHVLPWRMPGGMVINLAVYRCKNVKGYLYPVYHYFVTNPDTGVLIAIENPEKNS